MSDESEKMYNLIIKGCYATNKEMESMAPFWVLAIVIFLLVAGMASCQKKSEKVPVSPVEEVEVERCS